MVEYSILKVVHLGALIFWLGPALGAWLVLVVVKREFDLTHPVVTRVNKVFLYTVLLEHIAFFVLLITGVILAWRFGLWGAPWLKAKLLVLVVIVLPLELIDIWLGNWVAFQIADKQIAGVAPTKSQQRLLQFYHGGFTKLAIVLIPTSVLAIMVFAVSKQGLGF